MTHEFAVRPFTLSDRNDLQEIRKAAFAPVWASFRALLGENIFALQYADCDQKQADYLDALCVDSRKELYVLQHEDRMVGFIGLGVDETGVFGEIDLNAIDPRFQGRGGGLHMYRFALERLKQKGAVIALVGTGADPSHAAARAAYAKAGFHAGVPGVTLFQQL